MEVPRKMSQVGGGGRGDILFWVRTHTHPDAPTSLLTFDLSRNERMSEQAGVWRNEEEISENPMAGGGGGGSRGSNDGNIGGRQQQQGSTAAAQQQRVSDTTTGRGRRK